MKMFLEFGEAFGKGFQQTGALVKWHCAKLRSAHGARVGEHGGEVDAGGGCLRDEFTGGCIAHRDAVIPAALPNTAYIALQVHKLKSSKSRRLGRSAQA